MVKWFKETPKQDDLNFEDTEEYKREVQKVWDDLKGEMQDIADELEEVFRDKRDDINDDKNSAERVS